MRFYCGIDLGSRAAQLCVVDETERICLQKNVPCELAAVLAQLDREVQLRDEVRCKARIDAFVMEATFTGIGDRSWRKRQLALRHSFARIARRASTHGTGLAVPASISRAR